MTSVITFNKRKGKKKKKGKLRTSVSALGTSNSNNTKRNNNVDIQKKTIERMIEKQQQEVGLKSKKDEEFERSLAEYETEIAKEDVVLQKVTREKGSKYINTLLSTAKNREARNNIAKERLIQRRQDEEAAIYGDTETFVTAAYKKKLDDNIRQEQRLENIGFLDKSKSTAALNNNNKVIFIDNSSDGAGNNKMKKDENNKEEKEDDVTQQKMETNTTKNNNSRNFDENNIILTIEEKLKLATKNYQIRKLKREQQGIVF